MVPRQSDTRERLVATATRLFWRDGYSRTGVSSIIQQAGATSGSFYHFFATKEDLFLAVLDRFEERLEEMVHRAASDPSEPADARALTLFALHREFLERHAFDFGLSLAPLAADLGDDQDRVRTRVAAIFEHWQRCIENELLADADAASKDLGHHDLAGYIQALLEGAALQACVRRSSAPFAAVERRLRLHLEEIGRNNGDRPPAPASYRPVAINREPARQDWRAW